MKNIMGRISGIIRSADRKMKRGEIGVEAFKEVRRDLKLAQKIIFEEITTFLLYKTGINAKNVK